MILYGIVVIVLSVRVLSWIIWVELCGGKESYLEKMWEKEKKDVLGSMESMDEYDFY